MKGAFQRVASNAEARPLTNGLSAQANLYSPSSGAEAVDEVIPDMHSNAMNNPASIYEKHLLHFDHSLLPLR